MNMKLSLIFTFTLFLCLNLYSQENSSQNKEKVFGENIELIRFSSEQREIVESEKVESELTIISSKKSNRNKKKKPIPLEFTPAPISIEPK